MLAARDVPALPHEQHTVNIRTCGTTLYISGSLMKYDIPGTARHTTTHRQNIFSCNVSSVRAASTTRYVKKKDDNDTPPKTYAVVGHFHGVSAAADRLHRYTSRIYIQQTLQFYAHSQYAFTPYEDENWPQYRYHECLRPTSRYVRRLFDVSLSSPTSNNDVHHARSRALQRALQMLVQ